MKKIRFCLLISGEMNTPWENSATHFQQMLRKQEQIESWKIETFVPDHPVIQNIVYPEGDIYRVRVVFSEKVSKDAVEAVIEYWASIPYVGEFLGVDWERGDSGNPIAVIHVDTTKSTSDDIGGRRILELLNQFLKEGTPQRKTKGMTRAVNGVGDVVRCIIGE